jgi:hypothetical protein
MLAAGYITTALHGLFVVLQLAAGLTLATAKGVAPTLRLRQMI